MSTNPKALAPGKMLKSGRHTYRVVKVLGSGGFGITYLVEAQVTEGGEVYTYYFAMKEHFISRLCDRDGSSSAIVYSNPVREEVENSMKDFMAEAARLRQVGSRHENIVKVVDIFQANNTAYYVMDYLQGQNLRTYVTSRGRLSASEAVGIIRPVVDAIGFLHANRMTHLDIKPDNIMIVTGADGRPRPVLIDFGLSKHYDEHGSPTSTINTLACSDGYSPVEQYAGITAFSPEADIYALGATLLFALSGTNPPKSTDMRPQHLGALLQGQSPQLQTLVMRMMADRFSRLNRAADVLGAMDQITATPQAPAVPQTPQPPHPPVSPVQHPTAYGAPVPRPLAPKKSVNKGLIISLCIGIPVVLALVVLVLCAALDEPTYGSIDEDYLVLPNSDAVRIYRIGHAEENVSSSILNEVNLPAPTSPMRIALLWNCDVDVDLIVRTPDGVDIWRSDTNDPDTGGAFQGDRYSGPNFEEIRFSNPVNGIYRVFANVFGEIPEEGITLVAVCGGTNMNSTLTETLTVPEGSREIYQITEINITGFVEQTPNIPITSVGAQTQEFASSPNISNYIEANVSRRHNVQLEQRARTINGNGPLRITAYWDFDGDCDLYVNTPDEEDICYFHRTDTNNRGAHHSGDDMGGAGDNCESVYFTSPEAGTYDIFVKVRRVPGSHGNLWIVVNDGNENFTYATTISKYSDTPVNFRLASYTY